LRMPLNILESQGLPVSISQSQELMEEA
jgi:hypothetical protein